MKSPILRAANRGMSLIEILAATAVMSALLVPILLMMQYSSTTDYRSNNDILATSLAMSKMEELKSLPYFKLENILLGLHAHDTQRIDYPNSTRFVRGPFETRPETPDIAEPNLYKSGPTVFHRYTYLTYFPYSMPNPNADDFDQMKKRIKIRVHIYWKDRLSNNVYVDQELSFQAIVHDENYNPKPLFNQLMKTN